MCATTSATTPTEAGSGAARSSQQHGPTDGELHKTAGCERVFTDESNAVAAHVDRLAGASRHHYSILRHFVAHVPLHRETEFTASVVVLFREIHASVPPPLLA